MLKNPETANLKILATTDTRPLVKTFWVFTFTVLTTIGAQIEIPTQPVPFTLQTFFVLLAGVLLGKRMGAASMGLYLIFGITGLPVFSGSTMGLTRIIGPTGGYLLAFPITAFVVGYMTEIRKEYWWVIISMITGSLIFFCSGIIHLNFIYMHNWAQSFYSGFLIFSWWDVIKIIGAATIAHNYFKRTNL